MAQALLLPFSFFTKFLSFSVVIPYVCFSFNTPPSSVCSAKPLLFRPTIWVSDSWVTPVLFFFLKQQKMRTSNKRPAATAMMIINKVWSIGVDSDEEAALLLVPKT